MSDSLWLHGLSHVQLFETPCTVAHQAPLSMGLSRQEFWSELPFPSPGSLPDPGLEPWSPALQADSLLYEPPGKPLFPHGCLKHLLSHQFSHSVMSDSLRPHGLKHASLPCQLPTPGACSNSCPYIWWCIPTVSSPVIPFSSCLQSFPVSGSFPMSQFPWGGQSVRASASVFPMNIQDWFPLGLTGWISLLSKGLSKVFSSTTAQKHQFFSAQPF